MTPSEVLPGFVGPFKARVWPLEPTRWVVVDANGVGFSAPMQPDTAQALALILNSHAALLEACKRVRLEGIPDGDVYKLVCDAISLATKGTP